MKASTMPPSTCSLLVLALLALVAQHVAAETCQDLFNPSTTFSVESYQVAEAADAMKCFKAIQVDYNLAVQNTVALADYFKEYYTFVDIAKDPAATPMTILPHWTRVQKISIYKEKVDLVGELHALAKSLVPNTTVPGAPTVPLADVMFPIQDIFNRLRDTHVSAYGGSSFGNVLYNLRAILYVRPANKNQTGPDLLSNHTALQLNFKTTSGADLFVTDQSGKLIKTINGTAPLAWVKAFVQRPEFAINYKATGARINKLLGTGFNFSYSRLGDFSKTWLSSSNETKALKVQYADGTASFISLHFRLPNTFCNRSITQLGTQASKPGIAFKALQAAINASGARVVIDTSDMVSEPTSSAPGRKLADTTIPSTPGTIIYRDSGKLTVGGSYGIWDPPKGERFAVWKLSTFSGFLSSDYITPWRQFVAMATAANVSRLIIDVSGNGGGKVSTGYTAVAMLYPELFKPNAKPWVNTYSRHYGPAALYLQQNGLTAESVQAEFDKALKTDLITTRAAYLASNVTALQELINITANVLHAIDILVNTTSTKVDAITICTADDEECASFRKAWQYASGMLSLNVTAEALASTLTPEQLTAYMSNLTASLSAFAPFVKYSLTPASPLNATNIYDNPVNVSVAGGTEWRTVKYYLVSANNYTIPAHPFKQILAASDGLCGSTCDTFTRTAWVYSKSNASAVPFNFVTYGGTGKKDDISGTSFPGGNLMSNDANTQAWVYYGLTYLLAKFTGVQQYIDLASSIGKQLPSFPAFGISTTPSYSESSIFENNYGANPLPSEYLTIPSDYHIKAWYTAVSNTDGGDLPALYLDVAKYFKAK